MDQDSEERALAEAMDRLAARFPSVDREDIASIVREEYDGFADAHVRDYVANLVENAATERLRKTGATEVPVNAEAAASHFEVDPEVRLDPYEVEARSERSGLLNGDVSNN